MDYFLIFSFDIRYPKQPRENAYLKNVISMQ